MYLALKDIAVSPIHVFVSFGVVRERSLFMVGGGGGGCELEGGGPKFRDLLSWGGPTFCGGDFFEHII